MHTYSSKEPDFQKFSTLMYISFLPHKIHVLVFDRRIWVEQMKSILLINISIVPIVFLQHIVILFKLKRVHIDEKKVSVTNFLTYHKM